MRGREKDGRKREYTVMERRKRITYIPFDHLRSLGGPSG
jgi:hypothetical protein